ncbi:MAG TPA: Lrp/AsnC family transcriptional regulator [Kiloniellales bacterium]|nr:Lrp/AsnC family transcriptional regulator [Kiloniellales bacterium]
MTTAMAETAPTGTTPGEMRLSPLERRLLDEFQRDFPLTPRPYAELARRLGSDEDTVLAALTRLQRQGLIARVGAVAAPHRIGWSTLAAMAVPKERLDEVADLVNGFAEVNHNYERDHALNLWFVVTGRNREHVQGVLETIAAETALAVLDLPLVEAYRLDLGFPLQWS